MRVAFYGRFSSDNQRDTSIEDQHRVVQRWAKSHGHEVIASFSDAAVSGANVRLLTGLQKALKLAFAQGAPFEAIAVDQLSRLSRDVGDTDSIVKRLRFHGIRVIAVGDGIDTSDDTTKVSVTVKSLVNELFLDDLRKTTKRGLDGRFLNGYATGGRTYGYRTEPVHEGGRTDAHGKPILAGYRVNIDTAEAAIILNIFRAFKKGLGEKTIAKLLNQRGEERIWRPNTIYLMLQNSKYIGRWHFNRREWRKDPETGRRVSRWRPAEQWETRTIESLRIVDDETWDAVQRRLRTRQRLFTKRRSATVHLLSGLLICDRCGGRLAIVAKNYYGCRNHAESGACGSDLRIRRQTIEELVIGELARHLPAYIETLHAAASKQSESNPNPQSATTLRNLTRLRKQAAGVLRVVQDGRLEGRALQEALGAYQRIWHQVEELEQQPKMETSENLVTEVHYDRAVVEDFVARLPDALRSDVQLGREFLRETLQSVRVSQGDHRVRQCPICGRSLGKITPQHLARHGVSLQESYERFPELGFTTEARLVIQPSPEGLLNTGKVFGLMVAGARFGLWKRPLKFDFLLSY